jgi:hypothetical protein
MGVTMFHRIFLRFPCSSASLINFDGCVLSAPDGSSPRGYSRRKLFVEYRLKYSALHHHASTQNSFSDNFVGCALSAPDGSSPRGYSRMFSGIVSSIDFCICRRQSCVFLTLPFFIHNSPYSILVEYLHPSS